MPGSIRFHLDENVDHAIADGLQRHGVDVTVTSEVGLLRATDDVQFAFTRDSTRVMVTHDEDFLVLHSQGILHAGIAYCPPDTHPIGYIMQALPLEAVDDARRLVVVYHWPGCSDYDKVSTKNCVAFPSREAAEQAGYRPTGNCR